MFDSVQGVEPQSETVWRQADKYRVRAFALPTNGSHRASYERTVESIRERLGANALEMQIPIGQESDFIGFVNLLEENAVTFSDELGVEPNIIEIPEELRELAAQKRATLVERIAETDDDLTMKFLEGETLSLTELKSALRAAVLANKVAPVFCGSSLRNKGVQAVLDAVIDYLPSPLDIPPVDATLMRDGSEVQRHADESEPLSALVFKIVTDPYMGRLAYIRVYSGKIKQNSTVYNASKDKKERVGRLLRMYADRREDIEELGAVILARSLV